MSRVPAESKTKLEVGFSVLIAVALISGALLVYEIVLMRRLLIESWHHFGYLVISAALLGFGASGTFLAIIERRVRARPQVVMYWCVVGLLLSLTILPRVSAMLPVASRFIPDDLWRQVGWWLLYWLAALVPFLVGAMFLGAVLMTAGERVGRVYAANLFGSALGAAGGMLIVARFPLAWSLWPTVVTVLIVLAIFLRRDWCSLVSAKRQWIYMRFAILLAAVIAVELVRPLVPSYDEYKYAGRLEHLAEQDSVRLVDSRGDPHGYVELYESDLFHDLPLLAISQVPPPMYSLLINGDPAGSILRIKGPQDAAVMDRTLMAFPYRLLKPRPAVLLVGETGGINIWLAVRRQADRLDVVQPNSSVVKLVSGVSDVFDHCTNIHHKHPRRLLASPNHPDYDLIQIVSLEGLGHGGAGMRGMAEDHLVTVEGLADCWRALSEDGALAISRGLQQPPCENIRIFATLVEALELCGVEDVARHMIQVRDYLGVCTIVLKSPLDNARREVLRAAIREHNLTPVWYDSLPPTEVNRPDEQDGPPDSRIDWLHHAATEVLSPRRAAFYDEWLLNVRPPSDDNPFFWDFYKPEAVGELRRVYGDLWLTRAELGRLFLYTSLAIAGGAAIVLILLPMGGITLWKWICYRRLRAAPPDQSDGESVMDSYTRPRAFHAIRTTIFTLVYFGGIGLGFMGIEMVLISRAIRYFGDPVFASALVIGGVLLVSGFGSLAGNKLIGRRFWFAPMLVAVAAVVVWLIAWRPATDPWILLGISLIASFFMGMPMPGGLAALDHKLPRLVPWAWGINGVASVIATSAAIAIAMTSGYRDVILLSAGVYSAAGLVACWYMQLYRKPTWAEAT